MKIEDLKKEMLVTDREKTHYGIGRIEEIKDNLVYVYYDEIDTRIHYKENEVALLEIFN